MTFKKTSLLLSLALLSYGAIAAPIEVKNKIEFTGRINADSCSLGSVSGDATSVKVNMGEVSVDNIGTVAAPKFTGASGSSQVNFNVTCKTAATITVKLAGSAPDVTGTDNKVLRVNGGTNSAGFAQGVGIAVFNTAESGSTAYNLTNGELYKETAGKDTPAGSAGQSRRISFAAAYVKTGADADIKPGIANASLPFIVSYE